MPNRIGWITIASVICMQAGCAYMPGREMFGRMSLPSPSATIAASEKQQEPAKAKRESMFGGRSNDARRESALEIARGKTYERGGDYERARKAYEEVRRREPENVTAAHRLGIVADIQNRHGEAEQLFLAALKNDPDNAEVMSDLGYCLFLQGDLEQAGEVLARAVDIEPTNLRAHNNLGLVLGHMGEYEAALAQFALAGSEADAYFNLAFVYAAQEKTDEAKHCFQRCLQVDSTHQPARDALVAFDEYERLSPALRDSLPAVASDGVRYVSYQEITGIGAEINGAVQQASAQTSIPSSRDAARSVSNIHQRSRGMLNRNMSSNRPSALAGRGSASDGPAAAE